MGYSAEIIADSRSIWGNRLTTMVVRFPRCILSEFNTHRVFSRNSASNRAIPTSRLIAMIREDPFVPVYWGANQKGMQAWHEVLEADQDAATAVWKDALENALQSAERLMALKIHKQTINRLLEPFMWHTVIVTATEWSNFFALRANKMAQPEMRIIAKMMRDLYLESTPVTLLPGQWHLPFIQPEERDGTFEHTAQARMISSARCARVSYLTHGGVRDHGADLSLYNGLVGEGHMSPLEHVATPTKGWHGNFNGWQQLRKLIPNEDDFGRAQQERDEQ